MRRNKRKSNEDTAMQEGAECCSVCGRSNCRSRSGMQEKQQQQKQQLSAGQQSMKQQLQTEQPAGTPKNRHTRHSRKDSNADPKNLFEVRVGQTVWVTSVDVDDPNMRRRLQDLGIIEGTRILCKQKAPSGNPKAYLVRGATVAIRRNDSELISVTTVPPEDVPVISPDNTATEITAAETSDAEASAETAAEAM